MSQTCTCCEPADGAIVPVSEPPRTPDFHGKRQQVLCHRFAWTTKKALAFSCLGVFRKTCSLFFMKQEMSLNSDEALGNKAEPHWLIISSGSLMKTKHKLFLTHVNS